MSTQPTLGALIALDAEAKRDAIHIAVVPVVASAGSYFRPGDLFQLNESKNAEPATITNAIGVVDPFLKAGVRSGERFWGYLYPGAVTGLRHDWDHHAFPSPSAPQPIVVEAPEDLEITEIRSYAKSHGMTISEVIEAASDSLNDECRGCR